MASEGGTGEDGADTFTDTDAAFAKEKSAASGGLPTVTESPTDMVAPGPRVRRATRLDGPEHPNLAPNDNATASENIDAHLDVLTSWSKESAIVTPLGSKLAVATDGGIR